ncbi:hypothetical protein A0J48_000505 [Sphaerospermopsis aphanizomenoides BCCUSP55]|uniref:hypothetical protein n=1 Tax=Sphaerospermopsis aphanizomenoides TaxID=459663 RepID=UPI000A9EC938|nr:hypothetical protein [Sphaerospermopsis aphanizomenoides]MBK1986045.1 hypothetical protein [Sphaerospermopsis aphanizomenoides BCCUSP55]
MKKYRLFVVISAVCITLSIFYSLVGVSQTPKSKVILSTNPPLERLFPFEAATEKAQAPVNFTLEAVDAAGKNLENAVIKLEISTPKPTPWLTTDFPIVEGTKLLAMEVAAPKGKLEFQQVLPIRGDYQILAKVTPVVENAFEPYQETLNFHVRENPVKYKYFAILAAILLAMGLFGGWVIGGQEELRQGEIAPQSVRLLLSGLTVIAIVTLLFINITAEVAQAHGSEHDHKLEKIAPSVVKSQNFDVKIDGDKTATVGKLANLSVEVKDNTGKPIKDAVIDVKSVALEDNLTVFAYQGFSNQDGKLIWRSQFFDGAPHKVEVEVSNRQLPPIKVAQLVEVEGIQPPMLTRLISLFYLTGIVGIGMTIGLFMQELRKRQLRGI